MAKSSVKTKKSKVNEHSDLIEIDAWELANLELAVDNMKSEFMQHAGMYRMLDDLGWEPLGGGANQERGLRLEKLKEWSGVNRKLAAINPLVKKAIGVRIAYIFGEGVKFTNPKAGDVLAPRILTFIKDNEEFLFSEEAYASMEMSLNTDGQYFYLLEKRGNQRLITRVPMAEITDIAMETGNSENALFVKRTWHVTAKNRAADALSDLNGGTATEEVSAWYPVLDLDPKMARGVRTINDVPVDHTKHMLRASSNKQTGWTWGIPDIQAGKSWAEFYKEFLDSQFVLVKSLAQFTWKTTSNSAKGVKVAAATVGRPPTIGKDGRPMNVGGTYSSAGGDIAAVNKAGANINMESGRALAALAVAGLGLAIHHVLPDKGEASDETLDIPTLKTMVTRQKLHKRTFERIFKYFGFEVKVDFPPIQAEPIHRVVQAVTAAAGNNVLHPEEVRELILSALHPLGLEPKDEMTKKGQWVNFIGEIPQANANPGTTPIKDKNPSDPKKRSPAGPTSDGDHELRPSEAWTVEFLQRVLESISKK